MAPAARRFGKPGCFRICAALGAGLALGALSHFKADEMASAGGGGFSSLPGTSSIRMPLVAMEGSVVSDVRRASGGLSYIELAIQGLHGTDQVWVSASGRTTVFVRGPVSLPRGSTILVRCRPPTDVRPAIRARVFVDPKDIQLLQAASKAELRRTTLRADMLVALGKAGGEAGPLLEALFLGVRDELDSSLVNSFRDAGCAHILALSGQHVGVLAALAALVLGPLIGKYRAKPAACILAALYLGLVGPSPSVTRAIYMFWTAAALAAMDRPQKSGAILSLVFICTALIDPPSVRSLSFQLSYLAVAGIAAFSPGLDFFLRRWVPPVLSSVLAVGLASLAATSPLSILVFGRLNPFSPLVSAIAGILVGVLMWLGAFLAPLVSMVPAIQTLSSWLFLVPFRLLSWLMTTAAAFPALEFAQGPFRLAASLAVALSCALVYAWPHARYQFQLREQPQHASGHTLSGYRISGFPATRPGSISGGL
jgi:ComEC/Rec2-related protein